jgi:outer membrane protein assembly factor BamA
MCLCKLDTFQYRFIIQLLLLVVLSLSQTGCLSTRPLQSDEMLLYSQHVKGGKNVANDDLEALLPQKPNRKLLKTPLMPWLGLYNFGKLFYRPAKIQQKLTKLTEEFQKQQDTLTVNSLEEQNLIKSYEKKAEKLKIKLADGNWFMRVIGEKPAIITETDIETNTKKLERYLHDRGFFRATASYVKESSLLGNKVKVTYTVREDKSYFFHKDSLYSTDTTLIRLLLKDKKEDLSKNVKRYDQSFFENERIRIEKSLTDQGYYGFSRSYIRFKVDTTVATQMGIKEQGLVAYITMINTPPRHTEHRQYNIGAIDFVVDSQNEATTQAFDTVIFNNIHYYFRGRRYAKQILDSKVLLRPYHLFNNSSKLETQKQLSTLDQFKFAEITFKADTAANLLKTTIYTVPLEKYQFTGEGGVNVFQGYPGPFGNATLKVRSIFGGLESLEISARAGIEGQTGFFQSNSIYTGKELGLNASIVFPQMLLPRKYANRFSRNNPRTQIGLGFNFTDRPEYQRTNFKLAMNYSWQKGQKQHFNISLLDVNLLRTYFTLDTFRIYLQNLKTQKGNNLIESFRKSFVSSISGSYIYNENVVGQNNKAKYFRIFGESGGTTLNFVPNQRFSFVEKVFNKNGDTLKFYKFIKLNTEFRYYLPISRQSKLAFKISSGYVHSYGQDKELPYEKYFFVGGSNSLRAWLPRRVGPGITSSEVLPSQRIDYTFEKQGNIMFETSLEFRFPVMKLGGQINGAVFLDAGNVWLSNAQTRETGKFEVSHFLQDLAVGTGFGLRYDFTYFVLRTDFGIKVIEPARPEGQRYVLDKFSLKSSSINAPIFNLGIGYPF